MTSLPNGWLETPLSDIAVINMGQSPSGAYTNTKGDGLPLVGGAADFNNGSIQAVRFTTRPVKVSEAGDLILCIRATIGKVAFADREYCLGRGVAGIKSFLESRFLYYKLLESAEKLDEAGVGSTFKQIDKKTIANWPVQVPPQNEQKRIIIKLDRLLAGSKRAIAHLERIPDLVERYKQGILEAAFNGSLTASWPDHQSISPSDYLPISDVALGFHYGTSAKSSQFGQIPVLRMGNIKDGVLVWDHLVFTSNGKEISKYNLEVGDVLFNRTNSPELVGKTAVFKGERQSIFAGYLIRIRCSEQLVPDYLSYCINSPSGRAYCQKIKSDGVSQSNINARKIAAFRLPVPTVEEQLEIVRRVRHFFTWANTIQQHAKEAIDLVRMLDTSILTKGISGHLTLQDDNAQHASIFLNEIKIRIKDFQVRPRAKYTQVNSMDDSMKKQLVEVISGITDWQPAQEIFRQCGVGPSSTTEEIEIVYAQLRALHELGKFSIKAVRDSNGSKLYDVIKANI